MKAVNFPTYVKNSKARAWIEEVVALCKPDQIHWCDGSQSEYDQLCEQLVGQGALTRTVRSYRLYLAKHYGAVVSRLTGVLLSLVLGMRVPVYMVKHKLRGNVVAGEKATGYAAAAKQALVPLDV